MVLMGVAILILCVVTLYHIIEICKLQIKVDEIESKLNNSDTECIISDGFMKDEDFKYIIPRDKYEEYFGKEWKNVR